MNGDESTRKEIGQSSVLCKSENQMLLMRETDFSVIAVVVEPLKISIRCMAVAHEHHHCQKRPKMKYCIPLNFEGAIQIQDGLFKRHANIPLATSGRPPGLSCLPQTDNQRSSSRPIAELLLNRT